MLLKRKPADPGSSSGRKRVAGGAGGAIATPPGTTTGSQTTGGLTNGLGGADHENRELTLQEYYEAEEILKVIILKLLFKVGSNSSDNS